MFLSKALAAGLLPSLALSLPALVPRQSEGRLVVYWGIRDDTTLEDVCADPSYGIVNLSFLDRFFADGGYPSLSLAGLWESSEAQTQAGATSLKDGSPLVDAIKACQDSGKLVILSLGGAVADVTLDGDEQGEQIADTLWNLFGGGTEEAELRPFGDVKLDGFDLDNESHDATGYVAMVDRFRANFESDPSKTYYLTAAPQCPFPDESQPQDVCEKMDYVWVQFYNNGDCNIAQSGFEESVRTWSSSIGNAKLFIGALASDADGDSGYVDVDTMVGTLESVKAMNLTNYGGAMLWDAQLAVQNNNYHEAIAAAV